MPAPIRVNLPGVQVVPNLSHRGCYQTLSTQQDITGLIPCDDGQPAVKDPMDLPLVGVVQLDRRRRLYGPVGDLTGLVGYSSETWKTG